MCQLGVDDLTRNDLRLEAMRKEITKAGGKVEFKIEQYPDGSWAAESVNIDGIITGGKTTKNISPTIKDTVFTYFGIPPYLCIDEALA